MIGNFIPFFVLKTYHHNVSSMADIYKRFMQQNWVPHWDAHPDASDALLEMVIVEPRCHEFLVPVLKHFSAMIPHAALTIVHSRENKHIIDETVGDHNNIRRIASLPSNLNLAEYTRLFLSPSFWEQFKCDKILIFQTDTGILQNNVLDFLHVNYIGAPWVVNWAEDPSSQQVFVGNGGLSLRSRKAMIEVCKHPDAATFRGPEDIFFARHMKTAPVEMALRFSMESVAPNFLPFGFHRPWDAVHPAILQNMFSAAPSTKSLPSIKKVWITDQQTGTEIQLSADDRTLLEKWILLGTNAHGFKASAGARLPLSNIEKDVTLHFSTSDGNKIKVSCKFLVNEKVLSLFTHV